MKTIVACLIGCCLVAPASAQTLRERLKERVRDRLEKAPPPQATASAVTSAGTFTFSVESGGRTRFYKLHVPKKLDLSKPAPVVFAFHGGGGDMEYQSRDDRYGFIGKSESEGFAVVFPNGYSRLRSGKLATWNAGACCSDARDEKIDDVGFIRDLLVRLRGQIKVDDARIFAAGMSNGAMISYRLACEMPGTFRAIMAVAGTDNTLDCAPAKPVSVLHIHAKNDDHVLFDGGVGPGARDPKKVTEFKSVPATIAKWVKLNGCKAETTRTLEVPGAVCNVHAACNGGVRVQLCTTDKGGHSWPGGAKPRSGEPPSKAIAATDVMWDFFRQ